jgi:hypothetical protein
MILVLAALVMAGPAVVLSVGIARVVLVEAALGPGVGARMRGGLAPKCHVYSFGRVAIPKWLLSGR